MATYVSQSSKESYLFLFVIIHNFNNLTLIFIRKTFSIYLFQYKSLNENK